MAKKKTIAAKPTKAYGITFRSKLEAQWAVFLQNHFMCGTWEYEPLKYTHPQKGWDYTPDFWITSGGFQHFLEIKPEPPTEEYMAVLMEFATHILPHELIICVGGFYKTNIPDLVYTGTGAVEPLNGSLLFVKPEETIEVVRNTRFDLAMQRAKRNEGNVKELSAYISEWVTGEKTKNRKKAAAVKRKRKTAKKKTPRKRTRTTRRKRRGS